MQITGNGLHFRLWLCLLACLIYKVCSYCSAGLSRTPEERDTGWTQTVFSVSVASLTICLAFSAFFCTDRVSQRSLFINTKKRNNLLWPLISFPLMTFVTTWIILKYGTANGYTPSCGILLQWQFWWQPPPRQLVNHWKQRRKTTF